MKVIKTNINDLILLEPKVFKDERGFFMESFNQREFENIIGKPVTFLQDNHSKSVYGVLRGMHFQTAPYSQGKLVRCISGEVFDVAVDLRRNSSTFKKTYGVLLSAENKRQLWIPEGFAHGFLVLSETAEFVYKATEYYSPVAERCIKWDDPQLNIQWPNLKDYIISSKDKNGLSLDELYDDLFEA